MDTINLDSLYEEGFNINDFIEKYDKIDSLIEVSEVEEEFNIHIDDFIKPSVESDKESDKEFEFDIHINEFIRPQDESRDLSIDESSTELSNILVDSYSVEDLSNIYLDDSLYPGMEDLFPIFDFFKDDDLSFEVNIFKKKEERKQIRKNKVSRYLNKKKNRIWGRKFSYPSLKKKASLRPRVKGRFIKERNINIIN